MGIAFVDVKGSAKKGIENQYKFKDGDNIIRLVGEVLPRYVYWLKGENNKDIPLECLAFDRNLEKFTNVEPDHVREFHPEAKCTWSYVVQAIDPVEKKVVLVNLKKKLFQQIKSAAEDLGDPTDLEKGWDCHFKKEKTGPLPFNVEYTLQVLRLKPRALTAEERELIKDLKPIEEIVPRPTPEQQLTFLSKQGTSSEEEHSTESKVGSTDDLPQ
jgi:hypothetical protein